MFQPEEHDRPRPEDFRAPYFFCSTGEADKIRYITPSVADVLGYDPVHMLGKAFQHLLLPDDPLNLETKTDVIRVDSKSHHGVAARDRTVPGPNTAQAGEIRAVKNAQGERRILSIMVTPVRDCRQAATVRKHRLAQDITGQWAMVVRVRQRLSEICSQIAELSERDRIISEAATKGRSNESVAEELDVSVRTIERCRRELRKQFGVNHVAEIVTLLSECNTLKGLWQLHAPEPWQFGLGANHSESTSSKGSN